MTTKTVHELFFGRRRYLLLAFAFICLATRGRAQVTLASGTGSVLFPGTATGASSSSVSALIRLSADQRISSVTVVPSLGNKVEYQVGQISGCTVDGSTTNTSGTVCTIQIKFAPAYPGRRNVPLKFVTSTGTWYAGLSGLATGPAAVLTPGTISTAAGKGDFLTTGFSGDGGPATDALINQPYSVIADAAGNAYFSDMKNYRVRRIDAVTGVITTVAGNGSDTYSGDNGPATSAGMYPRGLAIDAAGNLYIADYYNYRVRRVDAATGIITTVAGNGTAGFSGDNGPATSAGMYPLSVAIDPAGDLYLSDTYDYFVSGTTSYRVRRVDASTGVITTVAGTGVEGSTGDGGLATAAEIWPGAIALDDAGNLYVTDAAGYSVRRVDANTHIISTVAGNGIRNSDGDGGPATSASLEASGLAFDAAGNLFIADGFRNSIRVVDAKTGIIRTVAGGHNSLLSGDGGSAIDAGMSVRDFGLDGIGNLWIADYTNNRIRKVDTHAVSFSFQSTAIGNTSSDSPQTAVLSNSGNSPLTFAVPSTGNNPAISSGFTFDSSTSGTCPLSTSASSAATLAVGQSCTLPVSFKPTAAGNITGTLTLTDDALNVASSSQIISLQGTATGGSASPTLTVQSATITYGTASTNLTAALAFTGVLPTGAVTFAVDSGTSKVATCTGSTSPLSCVASYPTGSLTAGAHSIAVAIAADANYSSATATGTLTVTAAAAPKASLNPASASFGSIAVGSASTVQAFTLANTGDADLAISSISLTGTGSAGFQIATATCGQSLAASHSCEIDVVFKPTAAGSVSATLTVVDNAGTQTAGLDGTGTQASSPQAALSPANVSFGNVTVGATSTAQTFTLKNAGTAGLPITSVSITGSQTASFQIASSTCGSALGAGASCAILISFKPKATGDASASLAVVDSVGTQTSVLTGTGTGGAVADFSIAASPSSQAIQRGNTTSYIISLQSLAATNPFGSAVELSASGLPEGASVVFAPAAVTPGAAQASSSTMTISVAPLHASTSPGWRFGKMSAITSLALLLPIWIRTRRRSITLASVIVCIGSLGITGCGSGTGFALPSSTSTVTVTAIGAGTTHTTTVTLTVN